MRWNTYSDYLREKYGMSVFRIGVDALFSCPNRTKERKGGCAFCDGTGAVSVYQRTGEGGFRHDSEYNGIVAEGNTAYKGGMKEPPERVVGRISQMTRGQLLLAIRNMAERPVPSNEPE